VVVSNESLLEQSEGPSGRAETDPHNRKAQNSGGISRERVPKVLVQNDFTWTQDSASNFYIGSTLNTYPGPAYTKTDQTVDTYGNVTQVKKYQFGSLTTPARSAVER
jgi:hypothetical protein